MMQKVKRPAATRTLMTELNGKSHRGEEIEEEEHKRGKEDEEEDKERGNMMSLLWFVLCITAKATAKYSNDPHISKQPTAVDRITQTKTTKRELLPADKQNETKNAKKLLLSVLQALLVTTNTSTTIACGEQKNCIGLQVLVVSPLTSRDKGE
eukprot:GHVS01017194.1.p1 GENE.GHVS01017194.1~~GHVS01017194.1.p1  ORF type:complete len:153 (+),score=28.78 GHVS01017194.1:305-763(+)